MSFETESYLIHGYRVSGRTRKQAEMSARALLDAGAPRDEAGGELPRDLVKVVLVLDRADLRVLADAVSNCREAILDDFGLGQPFARAAAASCVRILTQLKEAAR